jgi:hypothetical protein
MGPSDRFGKVSPLVRSHDEGLADGARCLEAALAYRARGLCAIPLCPPDHIGVGKGHGGAGGCQSPGKAPLVRGWTDFREPPSERDLRYWWRCWPNANVGLVMGGVGQLVGLDLDSDDGERLWAEFAGRLLAPPLEFVTGNGRRVLFGLPAGELFAIAFDRTVRRGFRILGDGSQTVAPPSRHAGGGYYGWKGDGEPLAFAMPDWSRLQPLPEWFGEVLARLGAHRNGAAHHEANGRGNADAGIDERTPLREHEDRRNETLHRMASSMRANGWTLAAIRGALLIFNDDVCQPPMSVAEIDGTIMKSVAKYACGERVRARLVYGGNGDGQAAGGASAPGQSGTPQPAPVLTRLDTVTPQPVLWSWPGRIPRGMVTLLDGNPGEGKSTLAIDVAARVTRAWAMPPDSGPAPGGKPEGVLLLSAEDDLRRTIRPRLDAAGADLARVFSFEAVRQGDDERPPVLPWDLALVEAMIRAEGIGLIVVDPFMAFLDGRIDAHRDSDVRRCLHNFKRLAERCVVAILIIRHLNKLVGGPALYRGGGSIGITGAARSALLAGRDPADPGRHVLASVKCNLGGMVPSLAYQLVGSLTDGVARIEWLGPVDLTADDILQHASGKRGPSTGDECAEAVREIVPAAGMESGELDRLLRERGFAPNAIRDGRRKAGVTAIRESFGPGAKYLVFPPEKPPAHEAGPPD